MHLCFLSLAQIATEQLQRAWLLLGPDDTEVNKVPPLSLEAHRFAGETDRWSSTHNVM